MREGRGRNSDPFPHGSLPRPSLAAHPERSASIREVKDDYC